MTVLNESSMVWAVTMSMCYLWERSRCFGLQQCDGLHEDLGEHGHLRRGGNAAVGRRNQHHLPLQELHDRTDIRRHAILQSEHTHTHAWVIQKTVKCTVRFAMQFIPILIGGAVGLLMQLHSKLVNVVLVSQLVQTAGWVDTGVLTAVSWDLLSCFCSSSSLLSIWLRCWRLMLRRGVLRCGEGDGRLQRGTSWYWLPRLSPQKLKILDTPENAPEAHTTHTHYYHIQHDLEHLYL